MCVWGERMAWGDREMEGKEGWLGNARGWDGKRRHRGRQRDVVWRREVKSNMFFVCPQPPVTCCVVLLEHAFVWAYSTLKQGPVPAHKCCLCVGIVCRGQKKVLGLKKVVEVCLRLVLTLSYFFGVCLPKTGPGCRHLRCRNQGRGRGTNCAKGFLMSLTPVCTCVPS